MKNSKLLIIDGLNLFRRIYEANPAPESVEKAQGAITSAKASLNRALSEHQPSHVLLAFDANGKNWRHQLYPKYKLNRKPMPEVFAMALVEAKSHLMAQGWYLSEISGVEADDTIASATYLARQAGADVVILTTDKDAVSLVGEGVQVRDHFNRVWRDKNWCETKFFGTQPEQLLDYLALTGDAVDGVPGVAKVGAKTAAKLLSQYGTLENVLAHAHLVKGVVGTNLIEQADVARMSRQLTELQLDVYPFGLDWPGMAKFSTA